MKRFERTTLLLNLINTGALAVGLAVVTVWGSGHDAQRVGAVIAAITGIFVILQVREEIEIERSKPQAPSSPQIAGLSPAQAKARELEEARRAGEESSMRQARLMLVAAIAMWLFLGELLHGFGDLALRSVMPH